MRSSAQAILLLFLLLSTIGRISPVSAESLDISATVPANATNFSTELTSDTATTTTLEQNQILTYTISYSSTLSTATEVTLEGSWTRGTIQGNTYPSTDVTSYISGSATNAIGNATPVINLINRKISWTFTLPANTTGSVSFQLNTSSTLTSTLPVSFKVSSRIIGPGFLTDANDLTYNFLSLPINPPGPTKTTTTTTPSPSTLPRPITFFTIRRIDVTEIGPTTANISITLSKPGSITLLYGNKPTALTETAYKANIAPFHQINLEKLLPDTTYYFKIIATSTESSITSDIYSLRTGSEQKVPQPAISGLIVTSNNTILTNPSLVITPTSSAKVVIPTDSVYEFRLAVANAENVVQMQAYLRNTVLGFSLPFIRKNDEVNDIAIDLVEVNPGNFVGKLITPPQIGRYELIVKVSDKAGNISEKKVAVFTVSRKFTVLDSTSRKPVENARVVLSVWNLRTNRFEELRPGSFSAASPTFTSTFGIVPVVLPVGRYKAEISQLQYQTKTIEFTIEDSGQYPEVLLTPTGFSLSGLVASLQSGLIDVFYQGTNDYLQTLSTSRRAIELANSISLVTLTIIFLLSLRTRLQIPFSKLPHYIHVFIKHGFRKQNLEGSISGKLIDAQTDKPIPSATIFLLDEITHVIKEYAVTNAQGLFLLTGVTPKQYRIEIRRLGYHPLDLEKIVAENTEMNAALSPKHHTEGVLPYLTHQIEKLFQTTFEVLLFFLVILILLNSLFTQSLTSFIFLLIGILNVRIFLTYKKRQLENF